ncbi:MAG: hypothetical protein IPK19_23010 [Chloroflexi bacterium]|nr:hypothetical protein [Chloroflexota bacterium]
MNYSVQTLPDEPIVLVTVGAEHSVGAESLQSMVETLETLDAQPGGVFLVYNLEEVSFSLDDVVSAITMATRQSRVFEHRNVMEILIVTRTTLVKIAANRMSSPLFGGHKMRVFESLDSALTYARATIRRGVRS